MIVGAGETLAGTEGVGSDGLGEGCGVPLGAGVEPDGVEVAEVDVWGLLDFFDVAEWLAPARATAPAARPGGADADGDGEGLGPGEPGSGLMYRLSLPCAEGVPDGSPRRLK